MSSNQNFQTPASRSVLLMQIAIAAVLCSGMPASAADLRVTNNNDFGAGSLRQAILEAQPNDRILFDGSLANSTITLTAPLGSFDPSLTIDGSAAPGLKIEGAILASAAAGMLNLGGNATYTSAQITSNTTFIQNADLTFDGGSISGDATIANGATVAMNGSVSGVTNLAAGGTLTGSGTLTGNTISSGTVNAGAAGAVGTLNFGSDLTVNAGSLQVDIDGGGAVPVAGTHNDVYQVAGDAQLNGGIVEITAQPSAYIDGASYRFLSANSVTGSFDGITNNFAFYDTTLIYAPDSVSFRLDDNGIPFADIGETCNQISVGAYLDSIRSRGAVDPALDEVILGLRGSTTATALTGLDHLGGQIYAYLPTIQMQHTSFTLAMLRDQLLTDRLYRLPDEPTRGWVRGYGIGGGADADACGTHGFNYSLGGTEFALQRGFGDGLDVGLFTNLGWSLVKTDEVDQRSDVASYQYGLSLQYLGEYGYVLGIAGGGNQNYNVRRGISDAEGLLTSAAESQFDGTQGFGSIEYGKLLQHGPVSWIPHLTMQYVTVNQDRIHEAGAGPVDLVGNSIDADSLRSVLGMSIQQAGPTAIGPATTKLRFGWMHEYLDTEQVFVSSFRDEIETVSVSGMDLGRDWAVMGLNLEWSVLPNLTTVLGYQNQFNERQSLHTGSGGLEARW